MTQNRSLPIEPSLLSHVYWIGGSPCAGKSSVAQTLAHLYGLSVYACDAKTPDHLQHAQYDLQPTMHRIARMGWEQIWMRPVEELLHDALRFNHEEWDLFLEGYLAHPSQYPVVEGAVLLPELVAPLLSDPHRGIWMVPTEAFQRHHYAQRPWIQSILQDCSNPKAAFENWMQRDARFAQVVMGQAQERGLKVMVVDGSMALADTVRVVAAWFALSL